MGRGWLLAGLCTLGTADAGTLPGGTTIAFGDLYTHEGASTALQPAVDPTSYFNLAHCACSQPGAAAPGFVEGTFAYQLALATTGAPVHRPLELWVGAGCDNAATRATGCHRAASIADLWTIGTGALPELSIFDLMAPEPVLGSCDFRALTSGEWAIADGDGDGTYDYFSGMPIATDALPPPLPSDFRATARADGFDISWTPPGDTSDIAAYQVLCSRSTIDSPSNLGTPPAARYVTARALCGLALDVPLHPSDIDTGVSAGAVDAMTAIDLFQSIAQLDPTYLCGEQLDPTASHVTIGGLQTLQPNLVVLLAIDHAGNASATYFTSFLSAHVAHAGGSCAAGGDGGRSFVLVLAVGVLLVRRRLAQHR